MYTAMKSIFEDKNKQEDLFFKGPGKDLDVRCVRCFALPHYLHVLKLNDPGCTAFYLGCTAFGSGCVSLLIGLIRYYAWTVSVHVLKRVGSEYAALGLGCTAFLCVNSSFSSPFPVIAT